MVRILSQSFRYNNAFLKTKKFDLSSTKHVDADVDWIVGSANGTMKLVDFDGTVYEPGTAEYDTVYGGSKALWSGQHNLEYFGEKEFMMFDNAFRCTGADAWNTDGAGFVGDSRMLIVEVDEEENTATLVWEYKMVTRYHSISFDITFSFLFIAFSLLFIAFHCFSLRFHCFFNDFHCFSLLFYVF